MAGGCAVNSVLRKFSKKVPRGSIAPFLSLHESTPSSHDRSIPFFVSHLCVLVFRRAPLQHSIKVIVMRHSLYALRGEDVMAAEFEQVAWVTFAILALVVGAMVGLNAVGVAQVRECRTLVAIRKMYHVRDTCVSGSLAGLHPASLSKKQNGSLWG